MFPVLLQEKIISCIFAARTLQITRNKADRSINCLPPTYVSIHFFPSLIAKLLSYDSTGRQRLIHLSSAFERWQQT